MKLRTNTAGNCVGGEVFQLPAGSKPAAAQGCEQGFGLGCGILGLRGLAGGGILRRLAAGQLFLHGIQCPALAAGTGCAVGGKVGAAGFRLRVLGLGIAGVQGLQLAVPGVQMALPHVLFSAVGSSTGQQGRARLVRGQG